MATLVTPDEVLDSGRPSPLVTQLSGRPFSLVTQPWRSSVRSVVRSRGSSLAIHPKDRAALEGGTANFWKRRYGSALLAFITMGLVCWAATTRIPHPAVGIGAVHPVDGLTIFAVFFVAALAIERLLEPLSNAMLPKATLANRAHEAMTEARSQAAQYRDAAEQRRSGLIEDERDDEKSLAEERTPLPPDADQSDATTTHAASNPPEQRGRSDKRPVQDETPVPTSSQKNDEAKRANDAIKTAARAIEALSVRQLQRATVFWTIATCLGMLLAAAMNLYFMNTVGITVGQRWEEILATGLIIGGGTKPLHDLVKLISTTSVGTESDSG